MKEREKKCWLYNFCFLLEKSFAVSYLYSVSFSKWRISLWFYFYNICSSKHIIVVLMHYYYNSVMIFGFSDFFFLSLKTVHSNFALFPHYGTLLPCLFFLVLLSIFEKFHILFHNFIKIFYMDTRFFIQNSSILNKMLCSGRK